MEYFFQSNTQRSNGRNSTIFCPIIKNKNQFTLMHTCSLTCTYTPIHTHAGKADRYAVTQAHTPPTSTKLMRLGLMN